MERVVNRSELATDEDPASSSPEPELVAKVKALGNFEFVDRVNLDDSTNKAEDDEEELDFRLFSSAGPKTESSSAAAKIKLRSPSPLNAEPGFVNPVRDSEYYFKGPPSEIEQEQFNAAAVSGMDVMGRSSSSWPGCSYPWKVLHLPMTRQNRALLSASEGQFKGLLGAAGSVNHRRLGKKARIRLRVKHEAAKKRQEKEQQTAGDRAAAEREKRNRRNREKKIKRRARDRARKAGAGAGAGSEVGEESDEGSPG